MAEVEAAIQEMFQAPHIRVSKTTHGFELGLPDLLKQDFITLMRLVTPS